MSAKENVYKWAFIERVLIAVINFGGNIILARMLSTDDFGLLAMIAIFTATAFNLSSCGLSDGLVHKLHPTPLDYSTVFVFNSSIGLLFGLSAIIFAEPIAGFFGHAEIAWIMRAYGVCFFFQTMSFVQETRLRKQLEMKKLCIARVAASITALVLGILLAALGCGYWALVSTQIFLSFFIFIYMVGLARWFPRIAFSVKSFKEFFNYGIHLMLAYLTNVVEQNINTFVLGRCYTSAQTGIYSQGAKLANVPFSVTEASLNSPFFVVASNEADAGRRRAAILSMMKNIVSINAAIALLLVLISRPAVEVLYGSKWIESAPILAVLALYGCLMCLKYFFQTIFKVYGLTKYVRNLTLCELAFQLCLLGLFYRMGLIAVALTQLSAIAVFVCIYTVIVSRTISMNGRELFDSLLRPAGLPLAAFAVGGAIKAALHYMLPSPPAALLECLAIALPYAAIIYPIIRRALKKSRA